MSTLHLLALLFAVAIASYAQALTGFAFGLILVGIVSSLHLVPLELIATTVSILSIVNGMPSLVRGFKRIHLGLFIPSSVSAAVMVLAGFELSRQISSEYLPVLKGAVGFTVLVVSMLLAFPVRPRKEVSGACHSATFGCAAGLMGGFFASSGPPLVYHFYRQPIGAEALRVTLVAVSVVAGVSRLAMSSVHGELGWDGVFLAAQALPIVVVMGWATSRFTPCLSNLHRRRLASALLAMTSFALIWPTLGAAQTCVANFLPAALQRSL